MLYYNILYGCTIFGAVVSRVFSSAVPETTMELIKRQSLKCNNHCPYGYVPDTEGELTCNCEDPCSRYLCAPGLDCEAVMPASCSTGLCRPEVNCVELVRARKNEEGTFFLQTPMDLTVFQQRDDPFTGWNSGTDVSVCSKPVLPEAVQCKHKQRRWFYNVSSARCERFHGCITGGNNFGRKRLCKDECKNYVIPQSQLRAIAPDDSACLAAPTHRDFRSCEHGRRRWFYNANTGRCEKFTDCQGTGEFFTRKVFCKAKCRSVIAKFRRSRNTGSRSKSQKPR